MRHVPTLVAVVVGALALGLLVAYFVGRTSWMRDLDERIYASPFGLLMGWWAYERGAMPRTAEELPRLGQVVPVTPSGRRRAVSHPPRRPASGEEDQP